VPKIETKSKISFIKVVVAAFLIKSIIFFNLKSYFSLPAEIFLSVWNVATWNAFYKVNLDWKDADWLGHAKCLVG
jgi:hypothetical protein